jgi:uncharacterized lipoprotein YddW (UPF0748 family)
MKSINNGKPIIFGTWLNFSEKTLYEWESFFENFIESGITEYFIHGKRDELQYLIDLTKNMKINIHGWIWTLNRPGDRQNIKNIDWYSVNKKGQNSYDMKPYVKYYQWLSPFSTAAMDYVKDNIYNLSKVKGLKSVHLDYVRYCDIFLPITLQNKYKIDQSDEIPEYDFGYHPNARKGFKGQFGVDPQELENGILKKEWNQYRCDAITTLVKELKKIVHREKTCLSAAVFPFPKMSSKMVRQDWSNWDLDIICPMNYHHFYDEDIEWIGRSVAYGIKHIKSESKYLSGIFIGALNKSDLRSAIIESVKNGANGVSIFSADGIKDSHLEVIRSFQVS